MGALKGRWQALRGLRVQITSDEDHVAAMQWITVAIILHNLVIEGNERGGEFIGAHTPGDEAQDTGGGDVEPIHGDGDENGARRQMLINELIYARTVL